MASPARLVNEYMISVHLFSRKGAKLAKKVDRVYRNSAAVLASMLLAPTLCLLLAWQIRAEGGKANGQKQAHADYARLAGTWMRPDGGYVLQLKAGIFV
jgi:hypothetical protein